MGGRDWFQASVSAVGIPAVAGSDLGRDNYVNWKGYPNSENSWLPVENLHSPELLANFHNCHSLATSLDDRPFPQLT